MKIAMLTLGCKVNQYEADSIAKMFVDKGYEVVNDLESDCDLVILSTCAVTNEAERKSRQMVSKINKACPNAKILVCGCASQHNANNFVNKKNVGIVLGTSSKQLIPDLINEKGAYVVEPPLDFEKMPTPIKHRTRAYVKVQDGCNNFCSYCLIPFLRGRCRSKSLEECLVECFQVARQSREIVLTGINLSAWGQDFNKELKDLLASLSTINARIRLSSMEMNIINNDFIKTIKEMPNFCEHFHLSMQSGCDKTLKDMNRHYTSEQFLEKVKMLRNAFPNCNITTDIIVGYPTETEQDFNQTLETVKKAKFGFIHIFPYSRRGGTVASRLPLIEPEIVANRVEKITKLRDELEKQFLQEQVGKYHEFLAEQEKDGFWIGHSRNFTKIYVQSNKIKSGDILTVIVIKSFKDGVLANVIETVD